MGKNKVIKKEEIKMASKQMKISDSLIISGMQIKMRVLPI